MNKTSLQIENCTITEHFSESLPLAYNKTGRPIIQNDTPLKLVSKVKFNRYYQLLIDLVSSHHGENMINPCVLDYNSVYFDHIVTFDLFDWVGERIPLKIIFQNCCFSKGIDVSSRNFQFGGKFPHSCFQGMVKFNGTEFHTKEGEETDFSFVKFEDQVEMNNLLIQGNLTFRETFFGSKVTFGGIRAKKVDFSEARFYGGHSEPDTFNSLNLGSCDEVIGCNSTFWGKTVFQFNQVNNVDLQHATFYRKVALHGEIRQKGNFDHVLFMDDSHLSGLMRSPGNITFMDATFQGGAYFSGKDFRSGWIFVGTKFYRAPYFSDGGLHPDAQLRTAKFYAFQSEQDYRNYRNLKRECSRLHAREEENHFFSYELRTLSNIHLRNIKTFHLAILSKTYALISDYGQGPARAFSALIVVMASFYCIYEYGCLMDNLSTTELSTSMVYTLQNIFRPFSQFSSDGLVKIQSGLLAILGIGQTLIFYVIFGFLLFAIRRRFRKQAD